MSVNIRKALYTVDLTAQPPNWKCGPADIARMTGRSEGRIGGWRRDGDLPPSPTNPLHRRGRSTWWTWADVLRFWSVRSGVPYDEWDHWRQFIEANFSDYLREGSDLPSTVKQLTRKRFNGQAFTAPSIIEIEGWRCNYSYATNNIRSQPPGTEDRAA